MGVISLYIFTVLFLGVIDKHAPCRTIRVRNKPSPWLNSNIKQMMFQRDWLKKKAVRTGTPKDWTAYRTLRNSVNKEIRLAKKSFYQKQINEVSGDQKATWKVLNDLLGKKSKNTKINGLKTDSGETLTNTSEIANYTDNRHFAAIGPNLASKISTDEVNVSPEQFLTKTDPGFYFKGVDSSRVLS